MFQPRITCACGLLALLATPALAQTYYYSPDEPTEAQDVIENELYPRAPQPGISQPRPSAARMYHEDEDEDEDRDEDETRTYYEPAPPVPYPPPRSSRYYDNAPRERSMYYDNAPRGKPMYYGNPPPPRIPNPPEQVIENANVPYVAGGAGLEERSAIEAEAGRYNLLIQNANPRGEFTAANTLMVSGNGAVFNARHVGPLIYLRLPPGNYSIIATHNNQRQKRTVRISARRQQHVSLIWRSRRH